MKILIADKLPQLATDYFVERGYEVENHAGMTEEELIACIAEYDALIVRSTTKVTRRVIEAASNLKIIGRSGVTVDNIDVACATERGIIVCNAPRSNIISAAEHTIGLIISLIRHIPQANASMHANKWEKPLFTGHELYGKTLAIFGLGHIGLLVAERARVFGMNLVGYDPYCSPERAAHMGVKLYENLEDILPIADVITVHLPKTPQTIGMFGPNEFVQMKDGVYIINASRGGIFNVDALANFVAAGKVAGAAIDVYETEPCTESPLHEFDNIILTPHIAASTEEAQLRASAQIVETIVNGLEGRPVLTAINVADTPDAILETVGPYMGAAQSAGSMISQILPEALSEMRVTAYGSISKVDPHLLATAALSGAFAATSETTVNFVNADAIAESRGVSVVTAVDSECDDYNSMVEFEAVAGGKTANVVFTLSGASSTPRIVSLMGFSTDFIPKHNVLVLKYGDRPGMVGKIGTILGNANINIDTLAIGRPATDEPTAMAAMNLDAQVDDEIVEQLASAISFSDCWRIEL